MAGTMVNQGAGHIAGSAAWLSPRQHELVALAAALGRGKFAPRAAQVDRDAVFPQANFDDLRAAGLLGLCVPREHGGLGGDFASFALVAAEIGRHCGATALCWSMHVATTLWAGEVADALQMTPAQRADHARCRALHWQRVVGPGEVYAQPFSEGGSAGAGTAAWDTLATKVEGGYRVSGHKVFASLAGAADHYSVMCTLDRPGAGLEDAVCLAVPAAAPGVAVGGSWDALGMRGTVSRRVSFDAVFVADQARLLPEGLYAQAARRWPHMFALLAPTYLGLAQAAYDFSVQYLRGELAGMPVKRRMYPTKQMAVAQMRIRLENMRALFMQTLREAGPDPDADARLRLYAAHCTVMEGAQEIAGLAIRTCGGHSLLKSLPLERIYRDSRCGSLMLPWTAELCVDHLGRECLYEAGESDEEIDG